MHFTNCSQLHIQQRQDYKSDLCRQTIMTQPLTGTKLTIQRWKDESIEFECVYLSGLYTLIESQAW